MLSGAWARPRTRLGDQQSSLFRLKTHINTHPTITKSLHMQHHDPAATKSDI